MQQYIDNRGCRVDAVVKPKKTILGVSLDAVRAKQVWVDSVLSDAERLLFLKNLFNNTMQPIDYDVLRQEVGRDLIHAYVLNHPPKRHKVAVIETDLHGLGRAIQWDMKPQGMFQCLSVCSDAVVLSVHQEETVYFFKKQDIETPAEAAYAARRAQECYNSAIPMALSHCYFINWTEVSELNIYPDLAFDAPLTVIPERDARWVAYGLALRGLDD